MQQVSHMGPVPRVYYFYLWMEVLRDHFPKIAPDPIKCHLCQRVNGHKCKTDGCARLMGVLALFALCTTLAVKMSTSTFVTGWCRSILAQLYNSSPVVKNFEEV
jgi:hypothetical protein